MTQILVNDFITVLLIFLRIAAMLMVVPVLGHKAVPNLAKLFLSLVIAYIVFLSIDTQKIEHEINLITLAVLGIREVLTGLILGYVLNFVFWGAAYAGSLIGFDMGLMFAEVLNPIEDFSANVIGEALLFITMLVFLLINGHHYIITGVVSSFKVVPIGSYTVTEPVYKLIVTYSISVFVIAIKIASPVIVSFFLIHLAEGIIARVIPNIQIFYVSQPFKLGFGIFLIAGLIPLYVYVIKDLLRGYEQSLLELIKTMSV